MTDDGVRFSRRVRSKLRREAHDLLHAGPPSVQLMWPIGPQVPDDARVQEVLDLCMRIGEVLLSSGESVDETTSVMLRIAAASGLSAVDVDVTFTSITMCCHRGMAASPVTSMRLVQYRSLDLTRLLAVGRVIDQVEAGDVDVRAAATELSEAVNSRHPYPRWVATVGGAGLAASIAFLLGGGLVTGLAAFGVTASLDRIGRLLNRRGLPPFFQQIVGGALATGTTVALFGLGAFPPGTRPSLVIAATITVLLSGLSLVSTGQDAITGYYVTSAGRAMEIVLLSAGLLVGVVLGLRVGLEFAPPLEVAGELPVGVGRFGLSMLAGATAAASYALAGYAPVRSLVAAALTGAAAWGTYGVLVQVAGVGPVPSTGAAAIVIGLASGMFRRGGGVPPLVVSLAGITPLVPGFSAYRGFYQLAVEGVADGLVTITLALAIGLALAAGVSFGDYLTRPNRNVSPSTPSPAPELGPA
ncbi:MAG: threonine/serine exporter family protein [Pseudonocardia sp.]|nr:threonine/serine exporter family protein [Pseudonocardia sp.]